MRISDWISDVCSSDLPLGAATWLATELYEDGDTLFGLADLGFGTPELGVFSLSEIAAVRLPYGMRIERDIGLESIHPISVWAIWSRRAGSLLHAQSPLRRAAANEQIGRAHVCTPV